MANWAESNQPAAMVQLYTYHWEGFVFGPVCFFFFIQSKSTSLPKVHTYSQNSPGISGDVSTIASMELKADAAMHWPPANKRTSRKSDGVMMKVSSS